MVWCFADYAKELWNQPPCNQFRHERFFGLVRPDGSLKPHAQVIQRFAESKPMVRPAPEYARLQVGPETYYEPGTQPLTRAIELYNTFLERKGV
jgi:hypothetical protein